MRDGILPHPDNGILLEAASEFPGSFGIYPEREIAFLFPLIGRIGTNALDDAVRRAIKLLSETLVSVLIGAINLLSSEGIEGCYEYSAIAAVLLVKQGERGRMLAGS